MALVLADRVRETTTTTGTGTVSLAGPVSGFQGFTTGVGNANTTYYTIVDAATGAWEVGLGTYTSSGSTLSRDTVFASSNSGSLVPFATGTKDVFVTQPAERAVYVLGAGTGLAAGAAAFTLNGVPYAGSTSTLSTGSGLTFDGTTLTANALTTTSTVTINGGTANGVTYLNGSKVLTTGSALTFDGTDFLLASGGLLDIDSTNAAVAMRIRQTTAGAGTEFNTTVTENTGVTFDSSDSGGATARSFIWTAGGSEQMRLTSTGLGIGTSSPGQKLQVSGAIYANNSTNVAFLMQGSQYNGSIANTSTANTYSLGYTTDASTHTSVLYWNASGNVGIGTSSPGSGGAASRLRVRQASDGAFYGLGIESAASTSELLYFANTGSRAVIGQTYLGSGGAYQPICFDTGGSERLRLDSSGNLGLGVTPSAWSTPAFNFGSNAIGSLSVIGTTTSLGNNINYNSGYKYTTSAAAGLYQISNNVHYWFIAPSGTAGNAITFTQAMTLHASGGLSLGNTSDPGAGTLNVNGITVGRGAGAVSTNTAVGASALAANTSGSENSAVGFQALQSTTTGVNNNAFGVQAMRYNTTGQANTAMGRNALYDNTTGSYNTAYGSFALVSNTTASNNTAVGYQAGYSNTTGSENTFFGQGAGYTNSVGRRNTFIGRQAGYTSNATTSGQGYNTCIGYAAGNSLTTGYANTFIGCQDDTTGYGSGHLVTTGSKNTILGGYNGNQGGLDIRTASNYIVLSDGDGTPWVSFNGNDGRLRLRQNGYNTITPALKVSGFGYDPSSYRAIVLGGQSTAGTYNTVCIGYDPSGNSSGSYSGSGSEVFFFNGVNFKTPNSTNTTFFNVMDFDSSGYGIKVYGNVGVGGATPASTGGGVTFPATQSASSDANTLDDYEEGTWTPTLYYQNATGVTRTYTTQEGGYTKIGNTVTIWGRLAGATSNSGSYANDNIGVTGLPFTASASGTAYPFATVGHGGFTGSSSVGVVGGQVSGTVIVFLQSAVVKTGNLADDFGSATAYEIYVTATYRV